MLPSGDTGSPGEDRHDASNAREPDDKESDSAEAKGHSSDAKPGNQDTNPEEGANREAGAPQNLGLLFVAAAVALALLLAFIGLIAFATMARLPGTSVGLTDGVVALDEARGAPLCAGERPAVANVVRSDPAGKRPEPARPS